MIVALLVVLLQTLPDAAEKADGKTIEKLLKDGADVNAAQADGMTALHWAAQHDDLETAARLLKAGAKAAAANQFGVTPLSLACVNGSSGMVALLLGGGADVRATLPGGETMLMTAARTGRVEPVVLLLAKGVPLEAKDGRGQTALMWAAAEGHADVVHLLVKTGADPKVRVKSGFTPMLFAARNGKIDVVKVLLKAGVDPNEAIETKGGRARGMAKNGTSALLLAVENGHFELALFLVEGGANPNDLRSGDGPLHALTWVRKPHRGDGEDGMPAPRGSGRLTSLEFVREIVKRGADVNLALGKGASSGGGVSAEGATPFFLAARRADVAYMKLLVELGADPARANKDGATPLMTAAGLGTLAPTEEAGTEEESIEAVQYLLSKGADVNAVDKNGETAMHGAAYKSLPKMAKLLAEGGAKIDVWNRKNRHGWTPVLIAEGFRPGNFKPSVETLAALHDVMRAAGLTPPPPTPRPDPAASKKGYDEKK
jgi:ankyrin repeat protein